MAHTAVQDSNIPTAGPLFENTCGRRGCVDMFNATHRCDTEWEPTAEILARFYNPVDDPAMFHNLGQCPPSDVMDVFADSELSDLTDDEATDDDSDYDVTAETSASCQAQEKGDLHAADYGDSRQQCHRPPHPRQPPRCSSPAARRRRHAVLEDDPWTTTVAPHHVVCRGCKHTSGSTGAPSIIRHSHRTFEGLWEKHRERCEKVKEGRAEPQMGELSAAKQVSRSPAKSHASPGSSRLLRVDCVVICNGKIYHM
ncbi:hypothetical protein B0H13DRAFT_1868004 [Mycena leptocephala]|nr:hypothetical protein B0H13DRAFT_1868004 [Mycena leptocephala]